MNDFLFNLINKIFFIPLAVQKRLLMRLNKFYAWYNPLPKKEKIQYKIVLYLYLLSFTYLGKLNYDIWFGDPSLSTNLEKGMQPVEEFMGVWASHFVALIVEQPIFINIEFLLLKILFLTAFLTLIKIFFKIDNKYFFMLLTFIFNYNFYSTFSVNLFFTWNFDDLISNLKSNSVTLQNLIILWDTKFENIKDNLNIFGIKFYNSFSLINVFEQIITAGDFSNLFFLLQNSNFFINFKNLFLQEIFVTNMMIFFLKKKIIIFFFLNFIIITTMLYNLSRLYKSINLIYALLHFLIFAVLSGLLILLWGNSYIAFCVLLIYGAAIPVLALYIIMLVNVDLIQRLFFFEHLTSNVILEKRKKLLLFLSIIFYLLFSLWNINFELKAVEYPWINEIYKNTFFLILNDKYSSSLQFSYGYTNIYDLILSFYSSDIDKVASSAFKTSFNELFALVLLLLVAIIVVISISRPTANMIKFPYEIILPNYKKFYKGFDFMTAKIFYRAKRLLDVTDFLQNKAYYNEFHGNTLNSKHDPIYLYHQYYTNFGFVDFGRWNTDMYGRLAVDPEPENPDDPWSEWYKVYNKTLFRDDLERSSQVWKFLGKPTNMTERESFTNEEILIYNATHWTYL